VTLNSTIVGAVATFAMHLVWAPVLMLLGVLVDRGATEDVIVPLMLAPLVFIGVAQLLYVGPAFWLARRRGAARLAQGILIGAGITLVLNASTWALISLNA